MAAFLSQQDDENGQLSCRAVVSTAAGQLCRGVAFYKNALQQRFTKKSPMTANGHNMNMKIHRRLFAQPKAAESKYDSALLIADIHIPQGFYKESHSPAAWVPASSFQ